MPSYIELNKNTTFPSASSSSKLILGVDNSGQISLTDNTGQTTTSGPKYKVYTALLTQSGVDDTLQLTFGQPLVIGTTYYIEDNASGADLISVGAPNNNNGTYFVATRTTPTTWGNPEENFELTWTVGAPVVTAVLENTIGNIWFGYSSQGIYLALSNNLFTLNKTFIIGSMWGDDSATPRAFAGYYSDTNETRFANGAYNTDDNNYQIYLEIRVYN